MSSGPIEQTAGTLGLAPQYRVTLRFYHESGYRVVTSSPDPSRIPDCIDAVDALSYDSLVSLVTTLRSEVDRLRLELVLCDSDRRKAEAECRRLREAA